MCVLHSREMRSSGGEGGAPRGADRCGTRWGRTGTRGGHDRKRRESAGSVPEQTEVSLRTGSYLGGWKVALWVLASLLPLVDGLLPGESLRAEPSPEPESVLGKAVWIPPDNLEVEEPREGGEAHSSWGGLFAHPALAEDPALHRGRWDRSPPGSARPGRPRKGEKKSKRDCRVRIKNLRVRDLGLGYESDEIVRFKYCAGGCQRARSDHDLVLAALVRQGAIKAREGVSAHPCCRPTRYETVSFMDVENSWRTVERLSAAECSCVG
ncbi:artemin [Lepisosteus oculatus]|nr:PREDICTED: artemin [Lepisosteus oculatus]